MIYSDCNTVMGNYTEIYYYFRVCSYLASIYLMQNTALKFACKYYMKNSYWHSTYFVIFQWVYNILEGKTEQDRIIYDNKSESEGFVLLPDLKWDGLTKETLYLLAIVRQRGIKSLRDLDETHLPLLKRIRVEGKVN